MSESEPEDPTEPTEVTVRGTVNHQQLTRLITSEVQSQVPDAPELDIDAIVDQVSDRIDIPESDTGDNVDQRLFQQLWNENRLQARPDNRSYVAPDTPTDPEYHNYGAWGTIVTVHEPVHWSESTVYAETSGEVNLHVYDFDYAHEETYNAGGMLHDISLKVYGDPDGDIVAPDLHLTPGTYFVTRDSRNPTADSVVPLKRLYPKEHVMDWGDFNAAHDVPVTFGPSWQLGRGGPGTDEFSHYQAQGWDSSLHNFSSWLFGYQND